MKYLITFAATILLLVATPATPLNTVPVTMEMITSDADDIFTAKVVSGICTSDKCGSKGNDSSIVFVVNCTLWVHGNCEKQQLLRSQRIMTPPQGGYYSSQSICIGCNYLVFINPDKKHNYIWLFRLRENNSQLVTVGSIQPFKDLQIQRHVDADFPEENYSFYKIEDVLAEIKKIKSSQ